MNTERALASGHRLSERGASAIEYTLLIALMSLVCIPTMSNITASGTLAAERFSNALQPASSTMSDHMHMGGNDGVDGSSHVGDGSGFIGEVRSLHGGGSNGTVTCKSDNCSNSVANDGDGNDGDNPNGYPRR